MAGRGHIEGVRPGEPAPSSGICPRGHEGPRGACWLCRTDESSVSQAGAAAHRSVHRESAGVSPADEAKLVEAAGKLSWPGVAGRRLQPCSTFPLATWGL